jgi:hypothetical protein
MLFENVFLFLDWTNKLLNQFSLNLNEARLRFCFLLYIYLNISRYI